MLSAWCFHGCPGYVMRAFSRIVLHGFQTSLVCTQNKSCLHSKEALFAMQRSLVLKRGVTGLAGRVAPVRFRAGFACIRMGVRKGVKQKNPRTLTILGFLFP